MTGLGFLLNLRVYLLLAGTLMPITLSGVAGKFVELDWR
jgi:hypothetical protein